MLKGKYFKSLSINVTTSGAHRQSTSARYDDDTLIINRQWKSFETFEQVEFIGVEHNDANVKHGLLSRDESRSEHNTPIFPSCER